MKCRSCGEVWKSTKGALTCPFCGNDNTMTAEQIDEVCKKAHADLAERRYEEAAAGFLDAAERGSAEACCRYAECLERGRGIKKSAREALVWLKYAATLGSGEGAGKLYRSLSKVRFAKENPVNLDLWLKIAAELGDAHSLEECGDRYINEAWGEFHPRRALYCYARAAELEGGESAASKMARLLTAGTLVEPDPSAAKAYLKVATKGPFFSALLARRALASLRGVEEATVCAENYAYLEYPEDLFSLALAAAGAHEYEIAVLLYRRSADLGYTRAANCLGVCLEKGRGCDADPCEAIRLYRTAAESGNALACLNLGDCLRRGVGCDADEAAAFEWYLRAAELGNLHAQYMVANCYFDGKYTERDIKSAIAWYQRAALGSHPKAILRADELRRKMTDIYNAGIAAYSEGRYEDAVSYYSAAAEMGHTGALCNLGMTYQLGLGCERDARAACRCYAEAAEDGSDAAAYNLGLCYLRGEGVPHDYRLARNYLTAALNAGRRAAAPLLAEMSEKKKKKQLRHIYSVAASLHYMGKLEDAISLRALASELGHARAAFLLGCHFEFGYGIETDIKRAAVYYEKARALGYTSRTMKGSFLRFIKNINDSEKEEAEEIQNGEIDE